MSKWISYYIDPKDNKEFFVTKNSNDEWVYTEDFTQAFKFECWGQAIEATPTTENGKSTMPNAGIREIDLNINKV